MNDLLKASKRALKTLSQLNIGNYPPPLQGGLNDEIEDLFEAIKKAENQKAMTLEEFIQTYQKGYREGKEDALAQPDSSCNGMPAYEGPLSKSQALAQPEQEPVGYVTDSGTSAYFLKGVDLDDDTPLYTAPPQRTWVGLEDEDVATVKNEFNRGALWAEQILKEKNT